MCYINLANGKSDIAKPTLVFSETDRKNCFRGDTTMKEKSLAALHMVTDFVSANIVFVVIWSISMAVIVKLACA